MSVSVFVSHPQPFTAEQAAFRDALFLTLEDRGLEPRTLGVTEYDNEIPLAAVRRMLLESNGVLALGLRRYYVEKGATKPGHDNSQPLDGAWFTSPWAHLEVAMGFQMGLPIMVLREQGVVVDGIFDPGTVGRFVIEFDSTDAAAFLSAPQFRQPLAAWERDVRTVVKRRGQPPQLY